MCSRSPGKQHKRAWLLSELLSGFEAAAGEAQTRPAIHHQKPTKP